MACGCVGLCICGCVDVYMAVLQPYILTFQLIVIEHAMTCFLRILANEAWKALH